MALGRLLCDALPLKYVQVLCNVCRYFWPKLRGAGRTFCRDCVIAASDGVCRVTAVTSTASKVDFIKALGADDVVVAHDLSNFHK